MTAAAACGRRGVAAGVAAAVPLLLLVGVGWHPPAPASPPPGGWPPPPPNAAAPLLIEAEICTGPGWGGGGADMPGAATGQSYKPVAADTAPAARHHNRQPQHQETRGIAWCGGWQGHVGSFGPPAPHPMHTRHTHTHITHAPLSLQALPPCLRPVGRTLRHRGAPAAPPAGHGRRTTPGVGREGGRGRRGFGSSRSGR